ncbi:MAG: DNA polymerase III subunit beta [Parasphingorhabdus sp.]|uniref:DNA polymerase III subunit beta n=1 Tax=Parasphingorhabdus sp. TaxID=2709688 RepID=UPI0032996EEF
MQVELRQLKTAMNIVEAARVKRPTIPILSTVKARLNGGLRLETNDLDMTCVATLPGEGGKNEEFLICDPKQVMSAIGAAGGKQVSLQIKGPPKIQGRGIDHSLLITAGELHICQNNRMAPTDFPGNGAQVSDDQFQTDLSGAVIDQISRVFPAISKDECRYYLNGVNMKKMDDDWTYRFAATDGHRLMVIDVPLPGSKGELPSDVILPRQFIAAVNRHLSKSKDAIKMKLGGGSQPNREATTAPVSRYASRCSITGKVADLDVEFHGKLIDDTYPDYSRVIPTDVPRKVTASIRSLRQAVLSVGSACTTRFTPALSLNFTEGKVTLSKAMGDLDGKATFAIECDHNCDGMIVGFNGKYLLEALNSFKGDEVALEMEEPSEDTNGPDQFLQVSGPTLIRDPSDTEFFVVLMPMRV